MKRFGELTAVDGVSLELKSGECMGLLGPNGAGKSTLIRSIVAVLSRTPERSGLRGPCRFARCAHGARMGSAGPGALSQTECRENLESFGLYHGLRREELRTAVAWCLDWAALRDRAEESVKSLSGGMKRRLNMAAGLIHHPWLVLVDEPAMGVDPQSRQRIFEMIEKLHGEGMSIVYTTHYMEEAELLCDRVATSLAHPTGTYSTRLRQNRFEGQLNIGHHYFGSASHLNGPEHDFAGR